MNSCQSLHYVKTYFPEFTLAKNYIWQRLDFPENLFSTIYTCQNLHLPEITFRGKLIFQNLHLLEITFGRRQLHFPAKFFSIDFFFPRKFAF